MDSRDSRIAERAHEIWEAEGRPEGRHEEHWRRACEEVGAAPGSEPAAVAGGAETEAGGAVPGGAASPAAARP